MCGKVCASNRNQHNSHAKELSRSQSRKEGKPQCGCMTMEMLSVICIKYKHQIQCRGTQRGCGQTWEGRWPPAAVAFAQVSGLDTPPHRQHAGIRHGLAL